VIKDSFPSVRSLEIGKVDVAPISKVSNLDQAKRDRGREAIPVTSPGR
jgi:hypothetical protein